MRRSPVVAGLLDVVLILVFAAVGRRSHAEIGSILGVLVTAWPFLTGAAVGWIITVLWQRRAPWALRDGVLVWAATIVVGMLLRALTGAGVAASFVVVASIVTGVFLLGWRLVAAVVDRRRRIRSVTEHSMVR